MLTRRCWLLLASVLFSAMIPLLASLADPPKPGAAKGRKVALLIGVNVYQNRKLDPLQYAEKDMTDLAVVLKRAGFEVRMLLGSRSGDDQASRENILATFKATLRGIGKDDTVLLAFSGHGVQDFVDVRDADGNAVKNKDGQKVQKEVPFFVPREGVPTEPDTLVSLSEILKTLDDKGGGHNLLLVDACRSDPDPNKGARGGIDGSRVENLGEGTAAFFACSSRQQARETEKAGKGHGVFFHFVLEGLGGAKEATNTKGEVTWERLVPYVKEKVKEQIPEWFPDLAENKRQKPHAIGNLAGDPVLVTIATRRMADFVLPEDFKIDVRLQENMLSARSLSFSGDGSKLFVLYRGLLPDEASDGAPISLPSISIIDTKFGNPEKNYPLDVGLC